MRRRAELPNPLLLLAVDSYKTDCPTAVFPEPVTLLRNVESPSATLSLPVVVAVRARYPRAILEFAVVLFLNA